MLIRKLILFIILLNALFSFLPNLWSKGKNYGNYQEQYGEKLKSVPYYLRQKYLNDTGKGWPDASFDDRAQFLDNYFTEKAKIEKEQQKQIKTKVKAQGLKEKQKMQAQRAEVKKERQRQKEKQDELRAERQKKRNFDNIVKQQKKKMQQLRKKNKK